MLLAFTRSRTSPARGVGTSPVRTAVSPAALRTAIFMRPPPSMGGSARSLAVSRSSGTATQDQARLQHLLWRGRTGIIDQCDQVIRAALAERREVLSYGGERRGG